MTCLLYGISFSRCGHRAADPSPSGLPPGIGGAPVERIEEGGLSAAVSWIQPSELTPNIARALCYGRVVEALHADAAVLPMRYGCLFAERRQVVELLRVHGDEYTVTLHRLDGCVEMGVRALLPTPRRVPRPPCLSRPDGESGRTYLTERAQHYARREEVAGTIAAVAERLRGALGGLAERTQADPRLGSAWGLSSLYFLVRREAVEAFRGAFRRIEGLDPARLLLSGPWPPYNFVGPERGAIGPDMEPEDPHPPQRWGGERLLQIMARLP